MLQIDGWMISTIKTYIMGILLYFVVEAPIGMLIENCFRKKYATYYIFSLFYTHMSMY